MVRIMGLVSVTDTVRVSSCVMVGFRVKLGLVLGL